MKISYFPKQTAFQSEPIMSAFLNGCKNIGMTTIKDDLDADAAVIWSVLWKHRLEKNQEIYNHYRQINKPVFIIEVGTLDRGRTWKIAANNIDNTGIYGLDQEILPNRSQQLEITLRNIKIKRRPEIIIVGQQDKSLQWTSNLSIVDRIKETIKEIRQYSDRTIIVRPHPRNKINPWFEKNVTFELPVKLVNTYDKYNLEYNHHCMINYSSGPAVQAAINGIPVICDKNSLANSISSSIKNIENCKLPDRTEWFEKILHTEWLLDEISEGIPQSRILKSLKS